MAARPLVRVLGPIDVVVATRAVTVGGRRQRALVGALAVGAGHAVPIDHLAHVEWADDPPPSAATTLQSQVSHLRQILGHDAIKLVDHSYELDLGVVDVDARRFERLLHAAEADRTDPHRCYEATRDALALWRGRPFGELADDDPFLLEAIRLDELRIAALELSLEAELALGRADMIVAELEAAVREHPYRERLWRLLIESLAANERRVEALRACADLRDLLAQVGLTADRWVGELEQSILVGRDEDR